MIDSTFNRRGDLSRLLPSNVEIDKRLLRTIARDIIPPLERVLDQSLIKNTPPKRGPSSPRFVWSRNKAANARARRWWFANIADGNIPTNGSNYTRSGALQKAWDVSIVLERGKVLIRAINPSDGAIYVYGTVRKTQIPGHKRTGWPFAPDKLGAGRDVLNSRIRDLGQEILGNG